MLDTKHTTPSRDLEHASDTTPSRDLDNASATSHGSEHEEVQRGIAKVEGLSQAWGKSGLIVAYVGYVLCLDLFSYWD